MNRTRALDLPSPPRQVKGGPGKRIWFARVFVLPHTLVGIGALVGWLMAVASMFVSRPAVDAQVRGVYTTTSKGTTYYRAQVDYLDASGPHQDDHVSIDWETYDRLKAAPPGTGRLTLADEGVGPFRELRQQSGILGQLGVLAFATLWCGIWVTVVSVFNWQLWVVPWQTRRLVAEGSVARGRVVGKRQQKGKGTIYKVTYAFESVSGRHEREVKCEQAVWDKLAEDQVLTVLYWPDRPTRSIAYELEPYRVEFNGALITPPWLPS